MVTRSRLKVSGSGEMKCLCCTFGVRVDQPIATLAMLPRGGVLMARGFEPQPERSAQQCEATAGVACSLPVLRLQHLRSSLLIRTVMNRSICCTYDTLVSFWEQVRVSGAEEG